MAKQEGKSKRGGPRSRSGRKPGAFTVLKRRIESERAEDADYGFALFVSTMRDDNQDLELRLSCAREVMDRVLGRPKQPAEVETKAQILVSIDR